jgi:hypothetical protein
MDTEQTTKTLINELNTQLKEIFQPFFDSESHMDKEFPVVTYNNKPDQFIICKKQGDIYCIEGPKNKSLFKLPFCYFKSSPDDLTLSINHNLSSLFTRKYSNLISMSGDGHYRFFDSQHQIDLLSFLEQYVNTFHRNLLPSFTRLINNSCYNRDSAQFYYKNLDLQLDECKLHLKNLKEKAFFLSEYLQDAVIEKVIVYKTRTENEGSVHVLPFSPTYRASYDVTTLNLDTYTKKELNQVRIHYSGEFTFVSIGFKVRFKGYSLFFTTKEYIEDMEQAFNLKPMEFDGEYLYLGANYCEVGFGIKEGYSFNPRTENQDFIFYLQSKFIQRLASDGQTLSLPGLTYKVGGRKTVLKNMLKGEQLGTQRNRDRLSNSYHS